MARATLGVLLALLVAPPSGAAAQGYCALCHSEVAVKYRDSAHAYEDLACTDCHGGDAATTEVARAHRGLRARVERAGIPEFCGSCHADPVRMAPFGLPADQLALYRVSGHGHALAAGKDGAAVCTDCHGVHDILKADDPASPVHPRNLSATCAACHGADEGGVVAEYRHSVHYESLRAANPRAPDCVRCHGSHGARPPGVGSIDKVCGQCHVQAREALRHGPHAGGRDGAGEPQCEACHGNHRIERATHQMWTVVCVECHDGESEAMRTGAKVLTLLQQTEAEIARAHESTASARRVPLDVREYESRLEMAATYLEEARPRTHALDPESVEELTRKARSIAQQVQHDVANELHVLEGRDLVVLVLWLYILVTVAALQLYRRSLR